MNNYHHPSRRCGEGVGNLSAHKEFDRSSPALNTETKPTALKVGHGIVIQPFKTILFKLGLDRPVYPYIGNLVYNMLGLAKYGV